MHETGILISELNRRVIPGDYENVKCDRKKSNTLSLCKIMGSGCCNGKREMKCGHTCHAEASADQCVGSRTSWMVGGSGIPSGEKWTRMPQGDAKSKSGKGCCAGWQGKCDLCCPGEEEELDTYD